MKQILLFLMLIGLLTLCTHTLKAQIGNTKYGTSALQSNTTGFGNSAFGILSLGNNTTGNSNSSFGGTALEDNTTGNHNSAFGYNSLTDNISGSYNCAFGEAALGKNKSSYNTASGYVALFSNTTGQYNTASGSLSLFYNTTGTYNTASGYVALFSNTTGQYNTASGSQALYSNTTGLSNTATGYQSLYYNTSHYNTATGYQSLFTNSIGTQNTASGYQCLYYNTTGRNNTGNGFGALDRNTSGSNNTATGMNALFFNTTGVYNTGAGSQSLLNNTTGSKNTAIGDSAGYQFNYNNSTFVGVKTSSTVSGLYNITVLGSGAYATASNQVRIGNSVVTSIGGKVGWTTLSDGRFKRNVNEDVPGLAFINKLRPVTYTLDITELDKTMGITEQLTAEEGVAKATATKEKHTGFVAQEVEKAANELKYDFGGVDKPKNDKDLYGLRYGEFVVPLVKAVQELSKENEELSKKNDDLEARLVQLEALIKAGNSNTTVNTSSAYLQHNAPNPFNNSTIIRYNIPFNAASAKVVISDMKGSLIKNIAVNSRDNGQVILNRGSLAAGTYNYSLWVDGRQVDTKQLIVTK